MDIDNIAIYDSLYDLILEHDPELLNAADDEFKCWLEHASDFESEKLVVINNELLYVIDGINGDVLADPKTTGTIDQYIAGAEEYYRDEVL